ncbi:MAG: dihydroorotate dehydrogenase [Clostridia bacterium]|nr:dihydroorotate dehydrogenase [Clostridia bacterium]MBQ5812996.1 dihydroorotate dehydrogenase [Clostridia bacterium]
MNRLETTLSGIKLKNPVIPASGTFGFGQEMAHFYDLNVLGGISLKGTTGEERFGNPTPRIAECREGMLNAVGLQNPGVDAVVARELPAVRKIYDGVLLANISGFSIEEYVMVAEKFDKAPEIDILEINISCPNVRHGGMAFGTDPSAAEEVTKAVKAVTHKPVYMKLSPNVTDIAAIAKACEAGGADGITLINTLLGMVIDPRTGRPIVSTKMSGFSGPAIKPVALRMVYQVAQAVKLPIIGVGGISTADDVIEFMSAGASAIQVGAQNLVDPFACPNIINELPKKMDEYGIGSLKDIIGRSLTL